jgi:hypothetical protein
MPKFDKSAYKRGMHLTGGCFEADGLLVKDARKFDPPSPPARKAGPSPAIDPRIAFLRAHTARLNEIGQKLEALNAQVVKAVEQVRRR